MIEKVDLYDAPWYGYWGWHTGAFGADFFCFGWVGVRRGTR